MRYLSQVKYYDLTSVSSSGDNNVIVAQHSTIKRLNLTLSQVMWEHIHTNGRIESTIVSPMKRFVASLEENHQLLEGSYRMNVYDYESGAILYREVGTSPFKNLRFSDDDRKCIVHTRNQVKIFKIASGKHDNIFTMKSENILSVDECDIHDAMFFDDKGKNLLIANRNKIVFLKDGSQLVSRVIGKDAEKNFNDEIQTIDRVEDHTMLFSTPHHVSIVTLNKDPSRIPHEKDISSRVGCVYQIQSPTEIIYSAKRDHLTGLVVVHSNTSVKIINHATKLILHSIDVTGLCIVSTSFINLETFIIATKKSDDHPASMSVIKIYSFVDDVDERSLVTTVQKEKINEEDEESKNENQPKRKKRRTQLELLLS